MKVSTNITLTRINNKDITQINYFQRYEVVDTLDNTMSKILIVHKIVILMRIYRLMMGDKKKEKNILYKTVRELVRFSFN